MKKNKIFISLASAALLTVGAVSVSTNVNTDVVQAATKTKVKKSTKKVAKNKKTTIKSKKNAKGSKAKKPAVKTKKATEIVLSKNAAVYNAKGKRVKKSTLKKGTALKAYGTKTIKGKKYYVLAKGQYVKAGNAAVSKTTKQTEKTIVLSRKAYTYNAKGKRVGKSLKKGTTYKITGTKTIKGKKYYVVGKGKYIKQTDAKISKQKPVSPVVSVTNPTPVNTETPATTPNDGNTTTTTPVANTTDKLPVNNSGENTSAANNVNTPSDSASNTSSTNTSNAADSSTSTSAADNSNSNSTTTNNGTSNATTPTGTNANTNAQA